MPSLHSLLLVQMNDAFGHLDNGIARKVTDLLWKVRGWNSGCLWLIAAAWRCLARTARCGTIRMLLQCSGPVHFMRLFLLLAAAAGQISCPTLIRMRLDYNVACLAKSTIPFAFLLHARIGRMFRRDGAFLFCVMDSLWVWFSVFFLYLHVCFFCFRLWFIFYLRWLPNRFRFWWHTKKCFLALHRHNLNQGVWPKNHNKSYYLKYFTNFSHWMRTNNYTKNTHTYFCKFSAK